LFTPGLPDKSSQSLHPRLTVQLQVLCAAGHVGPLLLSAGLLHTCVFRHTLTGTAPSPHCTTAGAVLGCILLDTWGRRPVFLISGAGAAASYLVMGAALTAHGHDHNLAAEAATEGWLRGLLHAGVILSYVSEGVQVVHRCPLEVCKWFVYMRLPLVSLLWTGNGLWMSGQTPNC
jgi:hypothetical protein